MNQIYELTRDETHRASAWRAHNNSYFAHFHSTIELAYVESGVLCVIQDGVSTPVPRGHLIVNSSYVVHSYLTPESSDAVIATIPLSVVPSLQAQLSSSRFQSGVSDVRSIPECPRILNMMASPQNDGNERFVNCLAEALLALLIERIGLLPNTSDAGGGLIQRILLYVERHAAEPISVASTAAAFGYSEGRFSHLWGEQVGCSFTQYVSSLRCQMARRMLEAGDRPLIEVANACGFSSMRTFHRVYKAYVGETPGGRKR